MESPLIDVLRGAPAAGVPVVLTGAACAAELAGSSLPAMRANAAEMVRVQSAFQQASGVDWLIIYSDPYYLAEALGCRVTGGESGLDIEAPLGYEQVSGLEVTDFYAVPSCGVVLGSIELAVRQAPHLPVAVLFEGPFTTANRVFGIERTLKELIVAPDKVVACLEVIARALGRFAEEAKRRGASLVYMPDPMSTRDMISPNHYRRYAWTYQKAVFDAARQAGLRSMLHVCGHTKDRWPDMLAAGADGLSLDQVVEFQELRRHVGPGPVIAGNVDPVGTMLLRGPEDVAADAARAFAAAGPDRFILMPGCGVPPGTPVENLRALVECGRSLRPR
ncbi:MAG: hypothetical protein HY900_14160 [Deltaproteobacteria bacterium]|nr:hypothetical protein [Deltaproteobacteria bacterium]